MPIIDVQRRYRELGRLRLGARRRTEGGKLVPVRLSTWRLTSPAQWLLEAAAELWGGEVEAWADAPTEGEQWQLITDTDELPVYVPPQDVDSSQFYELWSGGGAQRRCDGATELIAGTACRCNPEHRECSITTHLMVLLPQLPDVGVWRVRTTSWNAATELPPTVDLLRRIHDQGAYPLGLLGIESRTTRSDGQTRHFSLPVLRFPSSIAAAERAGITVLSRNPERPALPQDQPGLPDEATFADEGAPWGLPPELPGHPVDSSYPPSGHPPEPGQQAAATEAAAVPGASAGEVSQPERGRSGQPTSPAEGDVWERYTMAMEAAVQLPSGATGAKAVAMPLAKDGKWGWPPRESWPADRLEQLAEVLEAYVADEAQVSAEGQA